MGDKNPKKAPKKKSTSDKAAAKANSGTVTSTTKKK